MVKIDVYSDVICPWCYIGKRRLEKGIALAGESAAVRWHAFELNPDLPREGVDRRSYRIRKFGSWERSLELDERIVRAGAGDGIQFHFEKMARTSNTFDSHRIVWLAGERGVQDAVVEALFRAYFSDGGNLADPGTLTAVASGAGLDAGAVAALLAGDDGRAAVLGAEQMGRRLGISGVPFFIFNDAVAVSGAQAPETFHAAITQAIAAGPADSCAVDPAAEGIRNC